MRKSVVLVVLCAVLLPSFAASPIVEAVISTGVNVARDALTVLLMALTTAGAAVYLAANIYAYFKLDGRSAEPHECGFEEGSVELITDEEYFEASHEAEIEAARADAEAFAAWADEWDNANGTGEADYAAWRN